MSELGDGPGATGQGAPGTPGPGEQPGQLPLAGQPMPGNAPYGYPPQGYAPAKTNSMAVLSLVMGVLSMVICPLTGFVGLWAGFSARRAIRESNGTETGDGVAIAGIVTSVLGLVVVGIAVVAIMAVTLLGHSASSKFTSVASAIS